MLVLATIILLAGGILAVACWIVGLAQAWKHDNQWEKEQQAWRQYIRSNELIDITKDHLL